MRPLKKGPVRPQDLPELFEKLHNSHVTSSFYMDLGIQGLRINSSLKITSFGREFFIVTRCLLRAWDQCPWFK